MTRKIHDACTRTLRAGRSDTPNSRPVQSHAPRFHSVSIPQILFLQTMERFALRLHIVPKTLPSVLGLSGRAMSFLVRVACRRHLKQFPNKTKHLAVSHLCVEVSLLAERSIALSSPIPDERTVNNQSSGAGSPQKLLPISSSKSSRSCWVFRT